MNLFQEAYPNASVSGCYFHLSQSILRKVGELGLRGQYDNDPNFNILVRCIAALSFVPVDDVSNVYNDIVGLFPMDDDACNELLSYFSTYYVHGAQVGRRNREPRFPPGLWNHAEDAVELAPKTTNAVEGKCPICHVLNDL